MSSTTVLMVDAAADLRPLIPALRSSGFAPAAAAIYLGTGGCGAFAATAQYVADLHGMGLALLPIFNDSPINGGSPANLSQAVSDVANACAQCKALGVPSGVYVATDIEETANAGLTGDYMAWLASEWRATRFGGAGIAYGALSDPRFGAAFDSALQMGPANAGRLLFWQASYIASWDGRTLPAWDAPLGPTTLPWLPAHQDQVCAWQFTDRGPGPVDLSLLRLPLPAYGTEGLWLPDGSVGQPAAPPPTGTLSAKAVAALAALQQASAALQEVRKDLEG